MSDPNDPDDINDDERRVLDELRDALGPDPLPSGTIERAEALATWFTVDEELTALLEEHGDELVGTRGLAAGLSFATADGTTVVEVDVVETPGSRRIDGQVLVGAADRASLVDESGSVVRSTAVDDLGRFDVELEAERRGPHRVRLTDRTGITVTTDWFVL